MTLRTGFPALLVTLRTLSAGGYKRSLSRALSLRGACSRLRGPPPRETAPFPPPSLTPILRNKREQRGRSGGDLQLAAILKSVLFSALFLFRIDSNIKCEPKDGSDCHLGPSLAEIRNNQLCGIQEGIIQEQKSLSHRNIPLLCPEMSPLTVGTAQQFLAGSRAVRVKGGVSEDFHRIAGL